MPEFLSPKPRRIKQYFDHIEVGDRVLDVGTGSGILAKMALAKGAKAVTAIDINPAAVVHAKIFVPQADVFQSNLFEKVEGTFDTIIFAAPWSEGEIKKPFDYALYDCGIVEKFFQNAKNHLAGNGHIWLQYCDAFPSKYNKLESWITDNGFIIEKSWSYTNWGKLVQRYVNIILYKIVSADKQ